MQRNRAALSRTEPAVALGHHILPTHRRLIAWKIAVLSRAKRAVAEEEPSQTHHAPRKRRHQGVFPLPARNRLIAWKIAVLSRAKRAVAQQDHSQTHQAVCERRHQEAFPEQPRSFPSSQARSRKRPNKRVQSTPLRVERDRRDFMCYTHLEGVPDLPIAARLTRKRWVARMRSCWD